MMERSAVFQEPAPQPGRSRRVTAVEDSTVQFGLVQEHQQRGPAVSASLLKRLEALGMGPGAVESWGTIHVQPLVPMCTYFVAETGSDFALIMVFCVFGPITNLKFSVPAVIAVAVSLTNMALFWRNGPATATTKQSKILFMIFLLSIMTASQ